MRPRGPRLVLVLGLAGLLVLAAHPSALASDLWGNVAPASPLGPGGLFGRYPLDHYALDQHFDAVSASLTGGVDVSGVPPMIAYFLASVLWLLTAFLANLLITLFGFAFSLDLLNGSDATGGAGALAPVSQAIHALYGNVLGQPWLVLAVAITGTWAMWKALVQRRYSETAGALGLSLICVCCALFFVARPGATVGSLSRWSNEMSGAFLSIASHGGGGSAEQAKEDTASQLFEALVFKPWVVLDFGGLEHCAVQGTGSEDSDPESAPVRPLSSDPGRDAALARRLAVGSEITADGKICVNNAAKYARHFLGFAPGSDERNAEYDALDHGDSSKLPEADKQRSGYRLGVADKPATDAMEAGGQYQRLLLALLLFCGELGAFCLLGGLSVGVILAQVLLLLLLAFSPVALIAAAIPGRGHAFFKGWLEKLAGFLLRKAAYSLVLAILLALNGALAGATDELGWLMSFGLQALFFWAVFLQRKTLTEGLIGIATGPAAPGRDAFLRLLSIYGGARVAGRFAGFARGRRSGDGEGAPRRTPRLGTSLSAPVGSGGPSMASPGPSERPAPEPSRRSGRDASTPGKVDRPAGAVAPAGKPAASGDPEQTSEAGESARTSVPRRSEPEPRPSGPHHQLELPVETPAPEKRDSLAEREDAPESKAEPERKVRRKFARTEAPPDRERDGEPPRARRRGRKGELP